MTFSRVAVVVAALLVLGVALAAKPSVVAFACPRADDAARFDKVKTWRMTIFWTGELHTSTTKDLGNGASHREKDDGQFTAQVDLKLEKTDESNDTTFMWAVPDGYVPIGICKGTSTHYWEDVYPGQPKAWARLTKTVSGLTAGSGRLDVNSEDGSVRTFAYIKSGPISIDSEGSTPGKIHQDGQGSVAAISELKDWECRVPDTGLTIASDQRTCTHQYLGVPTTVSWVLRPWEDEKDGEAHLAVPPDWIPEADSRVFATASWTGTATQVRFTLYNVSKEPGTCMNSTSDSTEPDLEIKQQGEYKVEKSGDTWIATADVGGRQKCELPIDCLDYGARGKLKCEVKIRGDWKVAKTDGGATFCRLPKDDDENGIADAWEEKEGVQGTAAADDNETSPGNKNNGDGFTLYEEYRGMMAKGKHTRLHPKEKDLVVVNLIGAAAKPGLDVFAKAAGVKVIECDANEADADSMVVNRHRNTVAYGGEQHALKLTYGDTGGAAGLTVPRKEGANRTGSPKDVLEIRVLAPGANAPAGAPDRAAAKDLAHELGHACGLLHHGEAGTVRLNSSDYDANGDVVIRANASEWTIYGADARVVSQRPFKIAKEFKIGFSQETPGAGDVGCIMCYDSVFSFSYRASPGHKELANKPNVAPGTSFCTSPEGTGYNKPTSKPWPLFGNAIPGRGNCKSRIRIKDW